VIRLAGALLASVTLLLTACGGGSGGSTDPVARGDALFHGSGTCATCHGADLNGTSMGPSFLQALYAPSRLTDRAVHDAVANGMQPTNWSFGPMPALTHLDDDDVDAILAYIRQIQQQNGIR
jgi:mono/diheme cytochrome c family protein